MGNPINFFIFACGYLIVIYVILTIIGRLNSERCPVCQSRWSTELVGEWGEEDWYCHDCNISWSVSYDKEKDSYPYWYDGTCNDCIDNKQSKQQTLDDAEVVDSPHNDTVEPPPDRFENNPFEDRHL